MNDFDINNLSKHLFWDVDIGKLQSDTNKNFIIQRVLEYGLYKDWKKIYNYYGIQIIVEVVSKFRSLDERAVSFISLLSQIPREKILMLHFETIDTKTLELLRKIQSIPEFSSLRLVGGTSFALQIGHRKSIDLDLFGIVDCDSISISKNLNAIGKTVILQNTENIHLYVVDGIKVDIVN